LVTPPFLSVIVCTYNRKKLLQDCLNSLVSQSIDPERFELIVVDNNSRDGTHSLVQSYEQWMKHLSYVVETKQGLSHARNCGYETARGDYLIYLDDDAIAPKAYLENISQVISEHTPDFLGGPVYPYYVTQKPWWFLDEYETRQYENKSGFSNKCSISGGNFVVRKSVLEKLGLFDPEYGMNGRNLGMHDERKLLETYRLCMPADQQKVYYSLECYILHRTPAEKMKLFYILRRRMASGYWKFFMFVDLKNVPSYRNAYIKIYKTLLTLYRGIFSLIKAGDFQMQSYIGLIIENSLRLAHELGYVFAQIKHSLSPKA
jgi:glucosyl-dolichyl phosphate glucuronosyltransferase